MIYGYKDISIDVYLSSNNFRVYVDIKYQKKQEESTNVEKTLREYFGSSMTTNLKQYRSWLKYDSLQNFTPPGRLVTSYEAAIASVPSQFNLYNVHLSEMNEEFESTLQNMLPFYISLATRIEAKYDWYYFLLYHHDTSTNSHNLAGYVTCTEYKSKDQSKHFALISQILILPLYQRQGHSSKITSTIFNYYLKKTNSRRNPSRKTSTSL